MAAETKPKFGLRRLFRLWRVYAMMDLLLVTRSTGQFVLWYFADMILNIAGVAGMLLLAERFAGVGIWSRNQIVFMLGYGATVNGIVSILFGYNVMFISRKIGRGQLDHLLVQPQPLWMALITEGFSPVYGTGSLIPGVGLLMWGVHRLHLVPTVGWLGLLAFDLLCSTIIVIAFQYVVGSAAFWAQRGAEEINSSSWQLLYQLKSYPLDALSAVATGGLLTVLPAGFFGWFPCRALLGLTDKPLARYGIALAALLFATLATLVFRQGLKHYARTGAQRYGDLGHRS